MTEQEFGQIYSRSFDLTVRFLVSRGVYYDAAIDAAQDGWARGWERREQLRDPAVLATWVNSIALRRYRTFVRDYSKDVNCTELPASLPSTSSNTEAAIDARRMMSLIRAGDRQLLCDFYLQGHSIRELAKMHGCSPTAMRIKLWRAKLIAQKKL